MAWLMIAQSSADDHRCSVGTGRDISRGFFMLAPPQRPSISVDVHTDWRCPLCPTFGHAPDLSGSESMS
jgi:hypothetical protein